MKAAIYTKYGPPEVIQILEIDKPAPKDNEVLIKVMASTVNRTDCGFRSAQYFVSRFFSGLFVPKYKTLGNEFSGVIEAVGKGVSVFQVGDKVFGYNDIKFGAHAEYMTIAENEAITTMPANFSFTEAAPLTEGGHYALCDIRAANVKAGQNVLINGATGAIGSAALQLVKHFGANVTAVGNTKNMELLKSLGADNLITCRRILQKLTGNSTLFLMLSGKVRFRNASHFSRKKGYIFQPSLAKTVKIFFMH
jgi:NADPH:quinone reductase-like Zn-dependent oxidoreductase